MRKILFVPLAVVMACFAVSCKKDEPKQKWQLPVPQAVDLGIEVDGRKVLWGSFNVGADSPSGDGLHLSWGELEPKKEYNWNHYLFGYPDSYKVTRYCPGDKFSSWAGDGSPDGYSVLQYDDDVARQRLKGHRWRSPTFAEIKALLATRTDPNYQWSYTRLNGVAGFWVISKKSGTEGNRIFLPFSGSITSGGEPQGKGTGCSFWSSTLDSSEPARAYTFYISRYSDGEERVGWGSNSRNNGFLIRPVYE